MNELCESSVSISQLKETRAGKVVARAKHSFHKELASTALNLEQCWRQRVSDEYDEHGDVCGDTDIELQLRQLVILLKQVTAEVEQDVDSTALEQVINNDDAIAEALSIAADGLVHEAPKLIRALVSAADPAVALRAVSLLRQEWSKIAMPVPGLDGGLGADQLAAYNGDWDVWRLLVLVSRLAPGALAPGMPPNFTVVNACLLREVEHWAIQGARGAAAKSAVAQSNQWKGNPGWRHLSGAGSEALMEHQQVAVARMHERDKQSDMGHFLIMDTGLGKTLTSLVYAYRWLCEHPHTKRILWVTPAGTTENLVNQLRQTWQVPVWLVPRVSKAAKPKLGDSHELILKDQQVNVIHADHLRTSIDKGLASAAARSFIVFDEVDELYSPTLRTSAARRLAQLCPKFVAQTATPMRKNESQLRTWLADTCSFPVDASNLLVAASSMVSIQLSLGIKAHEELVQVPMVDAVRFQCRQLAAERSWLRMSQVVQQNTECALVDEAIRRANADRAHHPDGGVLLVADNKAHAERLIAMCGRRLKTGGFDALEAEDTNEYAIIVVTKQLDRGYNSATRLGVMVTGAYPGNGASRHQIRGRLRRIGQKRSDVFFVTVVMRNSILQLLHERHSAVDSMNISLEQLGMTFSADVLSRLEQ